MRPPGLILLAAGGSKRMGRPKQLLDWNGRSFLRHACETALNTTCRPVVVVLGCEAPMCRRQTEGLDLITVVNNDWQKGMGHSLAVGIAALEENAPEATGALVMLVDQPMVTPSLLQTILARWSPPQWPVAATRYPHGGGVPAVIDRSFFAELRTLNADRGASGLIARESGRVALVDADTELIDFDTQEAYRSQMGPPLR